MSTEAKRCVVRSFRAAVFVIALLACLAAGAACAQTEEDQPGPTATLEEDILVLVNEARTAGGLSPLARVEALDGLALGHSRDMARTGQLSHDGFEDRADSARDVLGASSVGENVAVGYDSARAFVDGWLGSPGHRANIMNPSYRRTGLGCSEGYATQVFCD